MIKLLCGGSPCTYWSIAQKNSREVEPSGIGWELFKNYLIAKEKFQPDYFLYENNKSAAQPIKDQIAKEFGVTERSMFADDNGVRMTYINSSLVSAQNRQRFYVTNFGDIEQPEDRGILLRDILESGVMWNEATNGKSYALTSSYNKASENPTSDFGEEKRRPRVIEPVRIGTIENSAKNADFDSKQYRVYSPDGKSTTICGQGGGVGAKTGLYACPVEEANYEVIDGAEVFISETKIRQGDDCGTKQGKYVYLDGAKTNSITAGQAHNEKVIVPAPAGNWKTVYEVRDGKITIKDKQYPIKLADGYYIIRKLTVTECCRLQTMPDDYCRVVSPTQAYRGLGNGWTAEVIVHLLNHALRDVPRDEPITVLSMYDGIGTGRYCLNRMGFKNVTYHAYEIDKYAIKVAMSNYRDIIQHGDAFQVREPDWRLA